MQNKFKPGDIVKLFIEGPKMLVIEVLENEQVKCFWYNKHNQPHTEIFTSGLLELTTGENKSAGFFNS